MFAPMQGAYEKEANVLVNLKMQTMARCNRGTYEDGPANYPLCCNYTQRRRRKLAQIRGYLKPGTMFAPMQGAYENEAKVLVGLKTQSMALCKRGRTKTGQQTTLSAAIMHSPVNGNLRKFGVSSTSVQCFHLCKVHMTKKLRCW